MTTIGRDEAARAMTPANHAIRVVLGSALLGAIAACGGPAATQVPTAITPTVAPTTAVTTAPSPTPQLVAGDQHLLTPGAHRIDYAMVPGSIGPGPSFVFDIPASGWYNTGAFGVEWIYPEGIKYGPSFAVWNITNVYVDPCTDHKPRSTPPGPGIDELLEAVATQAGIQAGPLTAVTIDGHSGKFVDLTITADIYSCPDRFFTWGSEREGRHAWANGEVDRVYALDVDGKRVTFFTRVLWDSPTEHNGQLARIIRSIDIVP